MAGAFAAAHPAKADDESLVYSFKGGTDGSVPAAPLLDVGGVLYGTTSQGGAGSGAGTVFSLTQAGAKQVLYSFKKTPDGATPSAGLIYLKASYTAPPLLGALPLAQEPHVTTVAAQYLRCRAGAKKRLSMHFKALATGWDRTLA
jgi:uncharacterized repeat protein (TIGR03803 family)